MRIEKILKEYYNKRKETKENFNFFSAIVSGKNDKQHIEKYHSNFIAYLLDSKASHDFGTLFLRHFFEVLKGKFDLRDLPNEKTLTLERERQTTGGRFIDISLESKNDWIIFIENKIWSGEQQDQMKDYFEFARLKYKNRIGIYLTLRGEDPTSIDKTSILNGAYILVVLSYHEVIQWIQNCFLDKEVSKYPHVLSALKQYISVIKNLLKVMKEETTAIIKYLKEEKGRTSEIVSNIRIFNESVLELIKEVRNKFKEDLETEINARHEEMKFPKSLNIEIDQGIYLYSGDDEKGYGMGFKILRDNKEFKYGGANYGGVGNAIFIGKIDAHYSVGIDKANAELIRAYETPEWKKIVNSTADKIIKVVNDEVLPKLNT